MVNSLFLIDDDKIFNFINEKLIKKASIAHQIIVNNSGEQALNRLKELQENGEPSPEIIILDIKMPIMDGFEFLEEFEKLPQTFTENIKIAMLSSSLEDEEREKSYQFANVIDFINKPLTEEKIKNFINKLSVVVAE